MPTDMFRWPSFTTRLAFVAGLALACGGRESRSMRSAPEEPASTVASNNPAGVPAPASCSNEIADYIVMGSNEACSARELPECGAGTQPFVDECGCGCSGVPVQSRA